MPKWLSGIGLLYRVILPNLYATAVSRPWKYVSKNCLDMPEKSLVCCHILSGESVSISNTRTVPTTRMTGAVAYITIVSMSDLQRVLRYSNRFVPAIILSTYSGLIDNRILRVFIFLIKAFVDGFFKCGLLFLFRCGIKIY